MASGLYKNLLPANTLPLIALVLVAAILTDSLALAQVNVEPNTALLNEGDRTELLCRYGRSINYCRIEIPGEKVLNLSPDWSKTPGFTYFGAGLAAGQCGVSIERVKAVNNGQVKCSLGVEGEELSGTIDLVVALRPQQPIIELANKPDREGYFAEGSNFQARCIVRDGRPAANISWFIDEYPAEKRVSQLEVEASPTDRNMTLSTTKQEIQWHLGPEDNGRKLICRSHHQTDRENVPPQEGAYLLLVRFAPVRQPESLVYGLYLDHTAMINITIHANPAPVVEWTVDGVVIPQGTQNGRFAVYEPQYLGQDFYNVTMAIAGLTLEDTTKTYQLKASNAFGSTDYTVRISSSSTPPSAGLEIGAIVGIVVAVAVLVLIVLLVIFARATGRWCFGGKSIKSPTNETSDTESADVHAASTATTATTTATTPTATTATVTAPPTSAAAETAATGASNESEPSNSNNEDVTKRFKRLPKFAAFFMRKNETKRKQADNETGGNAAAAQPEGTDGNDNEPKEDNQLVYAELVLKPAAEKNEPLTTPKNSTEYAEIVYVQKNNPDVVKK